MLELISLDLEDLADALADQADYDHGGWSPVNGGGCLSQDDGYSLGVQAGEEPIRCLAADFTRFRRVAETSSTSSTRSDPGRSQARPQLDLRPGR